MDSLRDAFTSPRGDILTIIQDVLRNPSADTQASLLVFGILFILLVIIVLSVLLVVTSGATRRTGPREAETSRVADGSAPDVRSQRRPPRTARELLLGGLFSTAVIVLLVLVVWGATGISTASRFACESCHSDAPHVAAVDYDEHADVRCVACHETGGVLAQTFANVPDRLSHFAEGAQDVSDDRYGTAISSRACEACHGPTMRQVTRDEERGILMSHAEPVEGGAECVDCHELASGVVSKRTVGMDPCLRCHDGETASADCDFCHETDPARAIVAAEATTTAYAAELVGTPDCSGCHDTAACNDCHGIEMPHTVEFMRTGHARIAVEELWDGNTATSCDKCHYPDHRSCSRCHEQGFLAHGAHWEQAHKEAVWSPDNCGCHQQKAPRAVGGTEYNYCYTCHDSPPPGANVVRAR